MALHFLKCLEALDALPVLSRETMGIIYGIKEKSVSMVKDPIRSQGLDFYR